MCSVAQETEYLDFYDNRKKLQMQNNITQYVSQCINTGIAGSKLDQHKVYQNYVAWCKVLDLTPATKNIFSRHLYDIYAVEPDSARRYYLGLQYMGINEQPDEAQYRDLLTRRAPGLLPTFEAWCKDKTVGPLAVILAEAALDRVTVALRGVA